jgi:hypothetical protein
LPILIAKVRKNRQGVQRLDDVRRSAISSFIDLLSDQTVAPARTAGMAGSTTGTKPSKNAPQ